MISNRRSFFSKIAAFFAGSSAISAQSKKGKDVEFLEENDPKLAVADIRTIHLYGIRPSNVKVFCEKTKKFLTSPKIGIQYVDVIGRYYVYLDENSNYQVKDKQFLTVFYDLDGYEKPRYFSYSKYVSSAFPLPAYFNSK